MQPSRKTRVEGRTYANDLLVGPSFEIAVGSASEKWSPETGQKVVSSSLTPQNSAVAFGTEKGEEET